MMGESFSIDICVDCLFDLESDGCSNELNHGCNERTSWPDWNGYSVFATTDEPAFSWGPCDYCGSTLGGDRHAATAFTRSEDGL